MNRTILFACALFVLGTFSFAIGSSFVYADDVASQACPDNISAAECADLKAQYAKLQTEIDSWQKVLTDTQVKKNSLQGDVTTLNAQIAKATAAIKQKTLAINGLSSQITTKNNHITQLVGKIGQGHESLAALLRHQNEIDSVSIVEVALAADQAFDLFDDVDQMLSVASSLQTQFDVIRGVKTQTESERNALAEKQSQELDAKHVVETQKQQVAASEAEKQKLLTATKNNETAYSKILADRKAQAAAIRARLFPLRDAGGIQFADAVTYAQQASAKTGVRAALILGVLKQESNLGQNVGNCLVTNLSTGDGKGKNTGTPFAGVMKAPRDTVPFERITKALGLDWATTAVSCPQVGGYGGAMGPTQFIPSTWELFEGRIKAALGISATNPWGARDATMATGLYLGDWGAGAQTYSAERNAACAYFSGKACPGTGNWVDTYGTSVVNYADSFQKDIDFLKSN